MRAARGCKSEIKILCVLKKWFFEAPEIMREKRNERMAEIKLLDIIANANVQQIRRAIDNGADLNEIIEDGRTILMYAAAMNSDPEVIELLIKSGADVSAKTENGFTSLIAAAAHNHNPDVTRTIINNGGDISITNTDGMTVLMAAAAYCPNSKNMKVILDAGANTSLKDTRGRTAFDYAKNNSKTQDTEELNTLRKAAMNKADDVS
jgi:ankyrin repeat protein